MKTIILSLLLAVSACAADEKKLTKITPEELNSLLEPQVEYGEALSQAMQIKTALDARNKTLEALEKRIKETMARLNKKYETLGYTVDTRGNLKPVPDAKK